MTTTSPWAPNFEPPVPLRTERMQLKVLGPDVVELDYAAVMDSRRRLRKELQWGKSRRWPPDDFTHDENRIDLVNHLREFECRDAYAYTVLDSDQSKCIGCVYIEPFAKNARLAFWVIDNEITSGLESHLLAEVLAWLTVDWPFEQVLVPLRSSNPRCLALGDDLGLKPTPDGLPNHVNLIFSKRLD